MKSNNYSRTDQFAVAKQLEGLQEKFQVLNRDELADGLRSRLDRLNEHRLPWFPEILSLLLQLSHRPAQFSSLDKIEKPKPPVPEKPLTWKELDISDSAYCDDGIWDDVDFAEESEDDVSVLSVESSSRVQADARLEDEYVIPDPVFVSGEDEDLIASISSAQFWRPENNVAKQNKSSRVITELQMLRETIFMLQGLPTSIFCRLDGSIEVDRRYTLPHSSDEALLSVLRSFSLIGAKIDVSRRFTSVPQSIPYMQTFHRRIEDYLHKFDKFLSDIQFQYISPKSTVSISILQLLDDVRRESRLLLILADLVPAIQSEGGNTVRGLDLLYDLVCMTQATGDDAKFRLLAEFFLSCFETYARPIRLWMEKGQLGPREGTFFVRENPEHGGLRTLWHDRYTMDESLGQAPEFLRPVAHKIFNTGKSMIFLQHLSAPEMDLKTSLSLDIAPQPSLSLPFSALLESALEKLVDANHTATSNLLRKELDQQCGLWTSLHALEHIYLCKDMSISSIIDTKIFDLIDRQGAWNDRFLLTELAQNAFSTTPFVDPSGLVVRSFNSCQSPRSVKLLQALSFDYILPWPVANIIPDCTIYQRISTFLMQIRRAQHAIIKQRLQGTTNAAAYPLRHNMLWFLNTLYTHLTDLVISTASSEMRSSISSQDVDTMISLHREYLTSLESQCLLSTTLSPIHEAIINLLDLCISFADLHSPTHRRESTQYLSAQESDDEGSESEIQHPRTIPSHTPGNIPLGDLKNQFFGTLRFIAAGLKEVGRVDGQSSWEILAEKLEWRDGERRGAF